VIGAFGRVRLQAGLEAVVPKRGNQGSLDTLAVLALVKGGKLRQPGCVLVHHSRDGGGIPADRRIPAQPGTQFS
jgi:hypothetical protein